MSRSSASALLRPGVAGPRLVRAAAVAVGAVALATFAHGGLAGMPIPPPALLLALLGAWPITYAVTGRRMGFVALVGVLSLVQVISHLLFTVAHALAVSGPGSVLLTTGAQAGGHAGHGGRDQALGGTVTSGRMLLAHLMATVLSAAALAWGERLLWSATRLLPRLPSRPRLEPSGPRAAVGGDTAYVPAALGERPRVTRGPPPMPRTF